MLLSDFREAKHAAAKWDLPRGPGLAGELYNNSATSLDYLQPLWPRLTALHLNTVLAGVSWAMIEPTEGKFDFT